jgi:hypothetical protein
MGRLQISMMQRRGIGSIVPVCLQQHARVARKSQHLQLEADPCPVLESRWHKPISAMQLHVHCLMLLHRTHPT